VTAFAARLQDVGWLERGVDHTGQVGADGISVSLWLRP
jgi:hypothetical protein